MTATNLVNKFEYKPLYKPDQLICGTGQTAIVSGWTVKVRSAKNYSPTNLPLSGNFTAFSQSFPLIAEVASPADRG
jgi:thymidylate synthase